MPPDPRHSWDQQLAGGPYCGPSLLYHTRGGLPLLVKPEDVERAIVALGANLEVSAVCCLA